MKKFVLLVALVFAVGIISSPVSAKVKTDVKSSITVSADDNSVTPEGEKDKKETKETAKKAEAKGGGCGGEKAASAEKAGCGGEKSASAEKAGCGGEKTAEAKSEKK